MDGIRRYAGIDWASERHAVCVIDVRGSVESRFEVEHSAAGLRELARRLRGVEGEAIERPTDRSSTRCSRRVSGCSSSRAAT